MRRNPAHSPSGALSRSKPEAALLSNGDFPSKWESPSNVSLEDLGHLDSAPGLGSLLQAANE